MTSSLLLFVFLLQAEHQHHPPRSADEYARVLENPKRDSWQKPDDVMRALSLRADEVVADIGAGSGYFTRRFAGSAAKVYAVDIDPKLLEIVRRNAPANVETILAAAGDPKLPAGAIDTIFICDVLHHIGSRPAYYQKLSRALKPGGRIVIVDFYKRDLPVGPPVSMKLSEDEVIGELKAAGFRLSRRPDFLPHQYFLEFVK
jgi:ubiquinone/menaquinone biosynthesis C-methylase UbiE